ncbi:MAG: STAS/SEC14 domain-containing protein [Sphingomonas sp.]
MTFEADEATGVIEFTVDGGITRAEYDAAVEAMEAEIARRGSLSAVAVIRSFTGMELAAWWKDVSWGVTHASKMRRVAIVTDSGWIEAATRAGSVVLPAEAKVFAPSELEAARAWAREA